MITFNITPMPAPRMTSSDRWKTAGNSNPKFRQRKCVTNYFAYKNFILWTAKKEKFELPENLELVFLLPMPESWSKKKKEAMFAKPHKQKPDIDNMIKGFMDAFGIDDSFVYRVYAVKFWDYTGKILARDMKDTVI